VIVDGDPVVDLWCGEGDPDRPWDAETLTVVWSCTKGATALCAEKLADGGALDVDQPVVRYWPEFGAAGKAGTTVGQLLDHSAGLIAWPEYWKDVGADGRGLADWERMTGALAAAPPGWLPGTQAAYHALTFGWLVGEVVRRVDGRSLGRYFREEIAAPLGLDLWIGTPADVLPRVVQLRAGPPPGGQSLSAEEQPPAQVVDPIAHARALILAGDVSSPGAWPLSMMLVHPDLTFDITALMNEDWLRSAEVPAANGTGNATALARMYAALARGGELDGVSLVSADSVARWAAPRTLVPGATYCGLGYQLFDELLVPYGASTGTFGHAGAGGNLGFADPKRRLGFGFVKNRMMADSASSLALATAVYACL
jgi:CubicO group peptidase (beta-lactamase class C family)